MYDFHIEYDSKHEQWIARSNDLQMEGRAPATSGFDGYDRDYGPILAMMNLMDIAEIPDNVLKLIAKV